MRSIQYILPFNHITDVFLYGALYFALSLYIPCLFYLLVYQMAQLAPSQLFLLKKRISFTWPCYRCDRTSIPVAMARMLLWNYKLWHGRFHSNWNAQPATIALVLYCSSLLHPRGTSYADANGTISCNTLVLAHSPVFHSIQMHTKYLVV